MNPGLRGLTVEERHWLLAICKAAPDDSVMPLHAPPVVIQTLLSKRLIERCGSAFQGTLGGFAEVLRTSDGC